MALFRLLLAIFALSFGHGAAAQQPYPIVGVKSGINPRTGEVPIRRNINDLYATGGPQWELYIQALAAMQDANETNPLSLFQIAGIHGQPAIAWSGGGPQAGGSGGDGGYCPHNEYLFGTWHRAYLSLYEQVLVSQAKRIANNYPARYKRTYREAAESLRAPFWDWAEDYHVPPVTVLETLNITKRAGDSLLEVPVRNPLFSFRFPKSAISGGFGTAFIGRNETRRCTEAGQSYPGTSNDLLSDLGLKDMVYNALVKATSWEEMVSQASLGPSLEGPHNFVHINGACGGDFMDVGISAYDPLFMLHHCNADRLVALWQAVHYENASMHFSYSTGGTYGTPSGTIINPQSSLLPFWGTDGFLTSDSMFYIREWGYTYKPIRYWDQTPGQIKMAVSKLINNVYSPTPWTRRSARRRFVTKEYFAKLEVERSELDLPCVVKLYLRGNLAGSVTLLGMPTSGISYDEIPLRRSINAANIQSFAPEAVLPVIEQDMQVIIMKPDGTRISLEGVPSLKLQVQDVDVVQPTSEDELPTFGEPRSRPAVARPGRPITN